MKLLRKIGFREVEVKVKPGKRLRRKSPELEKCSKLKKDCQEIKVIIG